MAATTVSILIPLYNEEEYVGTLLERVMAAPLPEGVSREIIVVDDGSRDGSAEIVEDLAAAHPGVLRLIRQPRNQGKGAAIRTAIEHATGEFSIIQDADLEYDPREYGRVLGPLLEGKADAVFGSRFMISGERRVLYFWHSVANQILTGMCNIVADLNLTDMETCYKAFRTSLLKSIPLRSDRFGMEPELTIKLAKRRVRVYETPIAYHGRTYEEGKKIGLKDAFEAVYVILKYAFTSDLYKGSGPDILDALSGARRFNQWLGDTILPYVGSRVLEAGAGIGNLSGILSPRRERYIAGDIEQEYLARLRARFQHRPKVEVRHCDLENPDDFASLAGVVDSVVCLNVLEHIKDDAAGLRNIYTALEPGGRAIVLVPHGQEIFGSLDMALGHFRRYSREELRQRLEQAGFRVERILDFNRISRPPWYVTGRILKSRTLSRFLLRIFDRLVWLWRRIDARLPWPPASIIAIAVKDR
ncbi:MAG TPA: bifunctional glycosyltransferase/class I SAM-dependent methyltransferase [Bryobacteraceae bacterium]|nr:bifunctional glycosyltransferase/class I SAM-dependent methyltransferase [Bryobacteraceae bacterium]